MICREKGRYIVFCDLCGIRAKDQNKKILYFEEFYEAAEWKRKKENGWKIKKTKKGIGWVDICSRCINDLKKNGR